DLMMGKRKEDEGKTKQRLMWTLQDWGMLLDHHLTEITSKHCMAYMGESILKIDANSMADEVKAFKIKETNEAALKDWSPLHDKGMEQQCGKPSCGRSAVYRKIKGSEIKTIIALSNGKYEIVVEDKKKDAGKALHYHWELAMLMDAVITTFIDGKSESKRTERLTKAMELLCTIDATGLQAVRQACAEENCAFRGIVKNMCAGMKNPFIARKHERSSLNKCVFFWRTPNGGGDAIRDDKKQMMAAIRAVAMGRKAFPLHVAIQCKDLDSVVLLLANGIDPNAKDERGFRPLYEALQNGFVDIIKALLLFGADPKKNVAKGISFEKAIYPDMKKGFEELLKIVDDKFEFPPVKIEELENRRFEKALVDMEKALSEGADIHNLLSLDGGGIRGLVLIEILDAMERAYGPALLDRFRWVAGTSTGAILALALGQGKDIGECRRLYFRLKDLVFYRTVKLNPYPVKPLEEFLQREFKPDSRMKSLDNGASEDPQRRKKHVVVPTTDCSESTMKLKLFRNFEVPDQTKAENDESMNFRVWEAARCSSAAPTFFPPVAKKYVDGSVIANNPVLPLLRDFVACQEAVKLGLGSTPVAKPAKLGVVVSVGTGWKVVEQAKELIQPQAGETTCECIPDFRGASFLGLPGYAADTLQSAKQMLNGLKNQILRSETSVDNARDWTYSMNGAFFRFNLTLDKKFALDETNNVLLIDLLWKTRVYMRQQKTHVDKFVEILRKTTKEEEDGWSPSTDDTQEVEKEVVEMKEYYAWEKYEEPPAPQSEEGVANEMFLKSARQELEKDPNVLARAKLFENKHQRIARNSEVDKMADAISPDGEIYLEHARAELRVDPKVLARANFWENKRKRIARNAEIDKMADAISPDG
ncbi:hypothetical protein PMAYCL1PPCAC_32320, partial [Pristionchus mayeri]